MTKDVLCTYNTVAQIVPVSDGTLAWGSTDTFIQLQSAYDPNKSITGAFNDFPSGFNFWKNFYRNYVVLGAKVTYTMCQRSAGGTAQPPIRWGVFINGDAVAPAFDKWTESIGLPWNKSKSFNCNSDGSSRQSITWKFSPYKFWGVGVPDGLEDFQAPVTANPDLSAWAMPWYQVADTNAGALPYFTWETKLEQYVRFYNPFDVHTLDATFIPTQTLGDYE